KNTLSKIQNFNFCFHRKLKTEPAAGGQSGQRVNVLTMIVYPALVSFVLRPATLKKPRYGENFRDRMCNCNTVTRDAITIAIWSGVHPDTPLA
ncbi:hypothetical protein C9B38_25795, partial [Salmonella enterica]|nr:hypothetical protein [Salmonella enterica]